MIDAHECHLFGLERAAHLNGLSGRLLNEELDSGDRLAVKVALSDGRLQCVRAWAANVGRRASDEQVDSVLSCHDLAERVVLSQGDDILLTMGTILDGTWSPPTREAHSTPNLSSLAHLAAVNRAFARVVHSDQLWKAICGVRWMCKWGFEARMRRAPSSGWRAAYVAEERDAERTSITPAELHALRFDFRFWLVPGGNDGTFDTGLRRSVSQDVRLIAGDVEGNITDLVLDLSQHAPGEPRPSPVAAHGRMLGHPNSLRGDEEPIAWFLDEDGRGIQWGYVPQLWPKGVVRRLPSWGWEVCNPNVCLRALDFESGEGEAIQLANQHLLWGNLLDSLTMCQFSLPVVGAKEVGLVPTGGRGIPGLRVFTVFQ
jgi:hypothetical protein